ncbi:hypothetical protein PN450_06095 [Dolichospermum lemmermannii CS-548]|uniref:hypothetical protein n=1 Tax=Dolichospermum lemmermannii TaxID=54295 RepID=UPI00232F57EC|nr:hypothetical protein [Dolichospermum lemmermannii]MDB9436384.1 hypothetical protein [Dolichospermum lemmermannii CS-548]
MAITAITVEKALLNNQSILENLVLVEKLDAQSAEIISGGCCCNSDWDRYDDNRGWSNNRYNDNRGWGNNRYNCNRGGYDPNRYYIC